MRQPLGFVNPQYSSYVRKPEKTIYRLRQASRVWYNELKSYLPHIGFKKSHSDPSLFIFCSNSILAYVIVYVDDIIVTGCTTSVAQ